ncbi:hypothetical protein ACTMU2_15160 [Cupriavidus basilensis]
MLAVELARREIVGADPGQRRNLRDFEAAAARCCFGKAKDNNASCAYRPLRKRLAGPALHASGHSLRRSCS